jgi:DNA invertase Pin-like site-specific DNA recombinase
MSQRAAEYVRMSTEHQRYSTENQADAIRQYAARRSLEIVRTYADQGKSGLRLEGRDALKKLIADVQAGNTDFTTILVYDVSRWGRFQDADESAYYEYICKRAGICVDYCAEQFDNDGSPVSTIVKSIKRAMAGEYSRELSTKVFAGQGRLIELGFRQGGPPGFGLRRCLIDQNAVVKGELARGEHKSLQTDRVILVPGPADEVETVRWMYRTFVEDHGNEREIAEDLNKRGILTDLARAWNRDTVHQVLINEKYIGSNVWNRTSFMLKKKHGRNGPETWLRAKGAFESLVEPGIFAAAQAIIRERSLWLSDEALLETLRRLLQENGYLSGLVIDESDGAPSSAAYRSRFGSLLRAYQLIGFTPLTDYRRTTTVSRTTTARLLGQRCARLYTYRRRGAASSHSAIAAKATANTASRSNGSVDGERKLIGSSSPNGRAAQGKIRPILRTAQRHDLADSRCHRLHAGDDRRTVQLEELVPADLFRAHQSRPRQNLEMPGDDRSVLGKIFGDRLNVRPPFQHQRADEFHAHRFAQRDEEGGIEVVEAGVGGLLAHQGLGHRPKWSGPGGLVKSCRHRLIQFPRRASAAWCPAAPLARRRHKRSWRSAA